MDPGKRRGHVEVWGALGSRSAAVFDLDRDGDLDIVTNEFNAGPMVLVSDLSTRNKKLHFVEIELIGTVSNRSGLGATVMVGAGGRVITRCTTASRVIYPRACIRSISGSVRPRSSTGSRWVGHPG